MRHPHLMPYHRGDGRVAATTYADGSQPYFPEREPWTEGRVDAKMPVIDDCCLVLEDRSERVLLVREGGTWQLPRCPAVETAGGDNLDCGNGKCSRSLSVFFPRSSKAAAQSSGA